jgi:hypothetical protein
LVSKRKGGQNAGASKIANSTNIAVLPSALSGNVKSLSLTINALE